MILTVTLNPCMDHTAETDGLEIGGTNRVVSSRRDLGGKGINVAVALRQLGQDAACLVLSRSEDEDFLERALRGQGVPCRSMPAPGRLRVNLKLFDRRNGVMTECNETGAPVPEGTAERFLAMAAEELPKARLLVLSGSVPPGIPASVYRELAERAAALGVPTVLDASGPLLMEGLQAGPLLIKPNRAELQESLESELSTLEEAVQACRGLVEQYGVAYVCLSMGKEGAVLVSREGAWFSESVFIPVQGVQGAGDSMVAGLCLGLLEGAPPEELLRRGAAAAHGSLLLPGTLLCGKKEYQQMYPQIPVHRLSL
ncbi:MAG TPA: 1-phosphofructokinase family hexose kinase [Candidatus Caccousia avistercoris]|nr:1-phosphofructokinase family hexose kinase [Candidatus Caccousia avistercoris]